MYDILLQNDKQKNKIHDVLCFAIYLNRITENKIQDVTYDILKQYDKQKINSTMLCMTR